MGDRRGLNPQQPEPQSGALPLSYGRHWKMEIVDVVFGAVNLQGFTLASMKAE